MVSEETTVITEPLKSDGKTVDFFRAIQTMTEPEIPANENGFRDIVLGYGEAVFEADVNRRDSRKDYLAMCTHLGIDPQTPPELSVSSTHNAASDIHRWLDQVGKGLDVIQTAVAKPHYFVPMIRQSEKDLVLMSQPFAVYEFHGELSDALQTRAQFLLLSKKTAEGWNDILASIRLFRYVTIYQAWLEAITSGETQLLSPVIDVSPACEHWTPEQLSQAIKDLESLPNWQDRKTALTILQYTLLDIISATNDLDGLSRSLPREVREMADVLRVIAFDWNLVAKELNHEINAYGELLERAEGKRLDDQFDMLHLRQLGERQRDMALNKDVLPEFVRDHIESGGSLDILFTSGRSKLTGALAGKILVSWAAGELYRIQLMEETRCQALRLVLALELYHRENQKYPDSLEELHLKAMPVNMYLEYGKQGEGYRLMNKVFQLEKQ